MGYENVTKKFQTLQKMVANLVENKECATVTIFSICTNSAHEEYNF